MKVMQRRWIAIKPAIKRRPDNPTERATMTLHQTAKLNHLSFPTTNVSETAAFFEKYLGCEIVAIGGSYLLKRHDFDIVLDHVEEPVVWPKNFHSAWSWPASMTFIRCTRNFSTAACRWKRRCSTIPAARASSAARPAA